MFLNTLIFSLVVLCCRCELLWQRDPSPHCLLHRTQRYGAVLGGEDQLWYQWVHPCFTLFLHPLLFRGNWQCWQDSSWFCYTEGSHWLPQVLLQQRKLTIIYDRVWSNTVTATLSIYSCCDWREWLQKWGPPPTKKRKGGLPWFHVG